MHTWVGEAKRCQQLVVLRRVTMRSNIRLIWLGRPIAFCYAFISVKSMPSMRHIAEIDREVEASLAPFRTAVEQLSTIPGVKDLGARTILSEIGIDMSRFPSDAHLISWACLCPRNDESAGKRRSTRIRKGSPWLKTTLVQCAWAAARTKGSYLQAQFHRIRARRGVKKAIVAVAASILTAIYHMLKDGTMYRDLGPNHFDRRPRSARTTASSNDWLTSDMLWNSPHVPISVATADGSKEVSLYGTPAESLSSRIPIVVRITVPPCIGKGLGRDFDHARELRRRRVSIPGAKITSV